MGRRRCQGRPEDLRVPRRGGTGGDASSVGLKCGATREAANEWVLRYPATFYIATTPLSGHTA